MVTLGSHGCDRGMECELCIDDVLPESECETIRISRQLEYVLKCGTNLQPEQQYILTLAEIVVTRKK